MNANVLSTNFFQLIKNRKFIVGIIILTAVIVGTIIALLTYRLGLGFGDESTFYEFARNLSNGEVIYKDFIHFRTPGSYFLQALSIHIFGEQQSSVAFALYFEALVLYPLTFLIATAIFFKRKSPLYVLIAFLGIALLPAIAQLRAGFALLAIALYIESYRSTTKRNWYLVAAGLMSGITFCFGQETALMVIVCIAAGEVVRLNKDRIKKELINRLKYLLVGALIALVPLLIYLLVYSDIGTFLYYAFYYSFVQQPKFMDLAYPDLSMTNLIYFLPFVVYGLCFYVLYSAKKLGVGSALLLSFAILRLITLLGRSDIGHLIFSIGEIFIVVPFFLMSIKSATFNKKQFVNFLPYGLALVVIFIAAIKLSSVLLVLAPFVVLFAIKRRRFDVSVKTQSIQTKLNVYLLLGVSFIFILYFLYPSYKSTIESLRTSITGTNKSQPEIGGVKIDPVYYSQVQQVKRIVDPIKPNMIFAFPIQPFYYTLAPKHASRFITFEPQITIEEQKLTIDDLVKNKPEVIIFDPLQAIGLSGSLSLISDYIMTNYEVKEAVVNKEILWVMVPKSTPSKDQPLAFRLYQANKKNSGMVGIQSMDKGLINSLSQATQTGYFEIDNPIDSRLQIALISSTDIGSNLGDCGIVTIKYERTQDSKVICSSDQLVYIPIKASNSKVKIELSKKDLRNLVWNKAEIIE